MDLEVTLDIIDYAVLFNNEVDLTILESESMTFSCEVGLYANSTSDYVYATLPCLAGFARESSGAYGSVYAELPAMTAAIEEGAYVPPALQYVFAILPPLTAFCLIGTESPVSVDAILPTLQGRAYESAYGEVYATLPSMQGFAFEDPNPGEAWCVSVVYALDGVYAPIQHIVFLNANGQIIDTYSATRTLVATVLEQIQASGTFSVLGTYVASMTSSLSASTNHTALIGTIVGETTVYAPSLDEDGRVWVVNIDNGASSQYDDYGFNSFFESEGKYYGVADDGIYELDGATDAGIDIDALLEIGRSDLGIPNKKKIINVYAGVSSTGKMYLKVDADEQVYTYEARSSSTAIKTHRFDVGKGLEGNYYNLTLINQDGCDFDLETIHFEPIALKGKI